MNDEPAYLTLFQAAYWIASREVPPDIRKCDVLDEDRGHEPAPGLVEAFAGAEAELLRKLQLGHVVATGLNADEERQEIPPHFWQDAVTDLIDSTAGVPAGSASGLSAELRGAFVGAWRWKGVTIPTATVKKVWPGGQAAARTTYALASAKACEEELYNLMKAGPPTRAKREYREEMVPRYRISARAFDRAWANAASRSGNTDWAKAGRKSKH